MEQCDKLDVSLRELCRRLLDSEDKVDSIQNQVYIISGVGGGVALFLLVVVIALAIQISSLRQKAANLSEGKVTTTAPRDNTNTASKKLMRTSDELQMNGQQRPAAAAVPHSFAQPPKAVSAEEELAQLGFSSYTGNDSRALSPSAMSTSTTGGVRVLPRNPPSGFRNNGFNDNYM